MAVALDVETPCKIAISARTQSRVSSVSLAILFREDVLPKLVVFKFSNLLTQLSALPVIQACSSHNL